MSTVLTAPPAAAVGRPVLEVADLFRQYGPAYRDRQPLPLHHQRVMQAIEVCRTAALGGHLEQCNHCGHQRPVYNSCRNRHCPKCQASARAQWLADRQAELLPVGYFHNVFTLPHELNDLLAANQRVLYNLLFHSVAQTLQAFAADPAFGLGGQLGFTAVLHTWDQKLLYHVHLHCVIAGGALAGDGSRWLPARHNYLFPVRELSSAFRARYLHGVSRALAHGELILPGRLAALATAATLAEWLRPLRDKDWVVYSQPPWGGPDKALEYLSRYTHRIAISNHRLRRLEEGRVTFDYRDRRDGHRLKQLTVAADEFIRRFLMHVVPPSFCRLRQYGFLSNRVKEEQLQRCRVLLAPAPAAAGDAAAPRIEALPGTDAARTTCPQCGAGTMVVVERLPRATRPPPSARPASAPGDTS
jgi:hypothetical protein